MVWAFIMLENLGTYSLEQNFFVSNSFLLFMIALVKHFVGQSHEASPAWNSAHLFALNLISVEKEAIVVHKLLHITAS